VKVQPLQNGGGQERGIRSGTVPTPLVVGLGEACEIAQQEMMVHWLSLLLQIHERLVFYMLVNGFSTITNGCKIWLIDYFIKLRVN
jgi:cysteine desulfurase